MSINNRQETRINRNETIFIEVVSSYPYSEENCKMVICHSVDLSANGIKAQIDEKVPLNAIYQLCVELHQTAEKLFLVAQVKWVRPADDGLGYHVGLEIFESDETDIERWKLYIASELSA